MILGLLLSLLSSKHFVKPVRLDTKERDTGIPGRWTLDAGLWTLNPGRWILDAGL